jgi:general secretion pathway protein G
MRKSTLTQSAAFTLVEIMIVVAIIALLATIAVPSWLRARMRAQNVKFINDLRIYSDALNNYAVENKNFPTDDFPTGSLNNGTVDFTPYIKTAEEWTKEPSIGGTWDLLMNTDGVRAAVGSVGYNIDTRQLNLLEELGDNKDSATGAMRIIGPGYYLVIAETGP